MAGLGGGIGGGVIGGLASSTGGVNVTAAAPKVVRISSGAALANKISGADPVYPAIARSAHITGTVVLQATISKQGTISDLKVISGPPLLANAALEAVRTWRFKPTILNGEPVEASTIINANFNFGGG
jgi:protein TonB